MLAEKVVLLGLISVIFAQVLPDIRASNAGVAVGVAVLVIANAGGQRGAAPARTVVGDDGPTVRGDAA